MGPEGTYEATFVAEAIQCDIAVTMLCTTPGRAPKATFGLKYTMMVMNSTVISIRWFGVPTDEIEVLFENFGCR